MTKAINLAVESFNAIAMRSIKIPEWGDLEVCFRPLTVGDMKWVELRKPKTEYDSNLLLLIRKARNADGDKLFEPGDLQKLEDEVDMSVLARLIEFMGAGVARTLEEGKATLEADPT